MPAFKTNDGVSLHYETHGDSGSRPLILLHGFTGSGQVFKRNVHGLSQKFHVIVLDLRGHGQSEKPRAGYHVARLAVDLKNLIEHLQLAEGQIAAIGTSLGAAILWSYCELFTTKAFSHVIYVDQAPLQNYLSDWGPAYGNRGLNSPQALADVQRMLATDPETAHRGTIATCLSYRSHPQQGDADEKSKTWQDDEAFFLAEALRGDGWWYGKLMADHTALDWREAIRHAFGPGSGSLTKTLVVASTRSGCFPAAGPLKVVELANGGEGVEGGEGGVEGGLASGVTVEWGGHWCYWEEPARFNDVVLQFLS